MASSDMGSQPQQGTEEKPSTAEQVKSEAGRLTQAARSRTFSFVEERKTRMADNITGIAEVAHSAAQQFDQHGNPAVAEYIERAAAGLEHFSDTMRNRDISSLVGDVEGFARRQPAVFIGASVALGFLLTRFLKSSSERRDAERLGYGAGGYARGSDAKSSVERREHQEGMSGGRDSDRSRSRQSGGWPGGAGGGSQGTTRQDMREGFTGASRPGGPVGGAAQGGPMTGRSRARTTGTEGQGGSST